MEYENYTYYMYRHNKPLNEDKLYQLNVYDFKRCLKQDYIKIITNIINENPNIVSLDLMECELNKDDLSLIVELLKNNTSLVELKLKQAFLVEHTDKLIELLNNNTTITSLDLSCNLFGKHLGPFIEALKSNTTLIKLNLCNTNIMRYFTSEIFDYSYDKIYDKNIELIGEMLTVNTTLIELNLSNNFIECVSQITDALTKNTTLTSLNLSDNDIYIESVRDLIWNNNTSLTELDIHRDINIRVNEYDIYKALCHNSSLTKLGIDVGRGYGYDEFYKTEPLIVSILQSNTNLTSLDLYYYCSNIPKYRF